MKDERKKKWGKKKPTKATDNTVDNSILF